MGYCDEMGDEGEEMLTVREARERLKVGSTTMWRWIRDGKLTAVDDPLDARRKLIRAVQVEQLLKGSIPR